MKKLTLALALSLSSLAACGNDVVDAVSSWKDDACACKDAECATKQAKKFWDLAKKFKDEKPEKDVAKKVDKLADEGQECIEKLGVDVYEMAG